jgi:hypothetical protein
MLQRWKTILFGLAVALSVPTITYFEGLQKQLMTCTVDLATKAEICAFPGWVGPVIGVMIIALRMLTVGPVFKSNSGE